MNAAATRFLKIVFGSICLACLLGISLDLVTANVAVEYFSVHHPPVVATENPFVLAIVWGIGASWWFGAISGAVVATVNHRRRAPLATEKILKWVAIACVVLWLLMIAILIGVLLISSAIPEDSRSSSFEHDRRLFAVAVSHQFEYILGAVALLVILIKTWRSE